MSQRNEYDAIIIGSGIGGLTCGCYLAKAGLKALILEKEKTVGGYCRSFTKNGFTFNSYVRGVVGVGPGGALDKILIDLGLKNNIHFLRPEVYDEIQFLGRSIAIYNNFGKTVSEILESFPNHATAIKKFFSLVAETNLITEFYKYKNKSFQDLIDEYFDDKEIKFFLSILRIDSGLHPSETSALADLMLIRGNFIDGGYFPKGGMQVFSDSLEQCFCQNGGTVIKNAFVNKIIVDGHKAKGVTLATGEVFNSKVVISNSDATFTYNQLLSGANIKRRYINMLNRMKPSSSVFISHFAISESLRSHLRNECCAIWNFEDKIEDGIVCMLPSIADRNLSPSNNESITVYYGMPYNDHAYWKKNKQNILRIFQKRLFRIFPSAKGKILFSKSFTPIDIEKETMNRFGASRGWAPSINKQDGFLFSSTTPVENVFMVGHWNVALFGNGGVTFAAQAGRKVAKSLIKERKVLNF